MAKNITFLNNNNVANITANFERVNDALEDVLSRSGELPNSMSADIDLNGNDLLNVNIVDAENILVDGENITDIVAEVDTARDEAVAAASNAEIFATNAAASAEAAGLAVIGATQTYDTKADAEAALPMLQEGQAVWVLEDESAGGVRTFYRVESGALVDKKATIDGVIAPEVMGALPDTGTDQSSAFSTFSIAKKKFAFGAGTWQTDLEPYSGMVFEGAGKERTIIEAFTTDFGVPFENVSGIILRDLTLRGFGGLHFLNGLSGDITLENVRVDFGIYGLTASLDTSSILSSPDAIIERLRVLNSEFSDLTACAARLDCIIKNAWFEGNHVHDIVGGGRLVGGFRVGIDGDHPHEQFLAQRNVIFRSNVIEDCNNTTKTGDSTVGNNYELFGIMGLGRKIIMEGNIVRNVQGVISDNEALYTKAQIVSVSDNLVENSGSSEAAINIKGFSEIEADEPDGRFVQCNDNIVRFTEYEVDGQALLRSGIQIANEAAQCRGNIVDGANDSGIVVQGPTRNPGNYSDINVSENIIRNHLGTFGLRLRGGYERVSAKDNKISFGARVASVGAHAGIFVESVPGNRGVSYDMLEIWDNQIDMTELVLSGSATATGIESLVEYPYNSVRIGGGIIDLDPGLSTHRAVYIRDDRANNVIERLEIGEILLLGNQSISIGAGVTLKHYTLHQRFEITTTDNTSPALLSVPVPEGAVLSVKARTLAAAIAGTDAALYENHALFTRYGVAAPVQVGTTVEPVSIEDVTVDWNVFFSVLDDTNIQARVNGDDGQTINWSMMVDVETLN